MAHSAVIFKVFLISEVKTSQVVSQQKRFKPLNSSSIFKFILAFFVIRHKSLGMSFALWLILPYYLNLICVAFQKEKKNEEEKNDEELKDRHSLLHVQFSKYHLLIFAK